MPPDRSRSSFHPEASQVLQRVCPLPGTADDQIKASKIIMLSFQAADEPARE